MYAYDCAQLRETQHWTNTFLCCCALWFAGRADCPILGLAAVGGSPPSPLLCFFVYNFRLFKEISHLWKKISEV